MAIASGGTLGTGASSTSASSYTFTTATNTLAAGDFGILVAVSDNIATVDGTGNNDHTAVSGGAGEWRKLGEYTNSPGGVAADGVTTSVWLFLATGSVPTTTTITLRLSASATDKCCAFWKFTKASNTEILLQTGATNPITSEVNGANDFGSSAFAGLASAARLYLRGLGKEANSTTGLTVSTNFTELTGTRSRNNAAAVIVRGEFRVNTSTGETSNPTLAVTGDTAGLFFALVESTLPVANVAPERLVAQVPTARRINQALPPQNFLGLVTGGAPVANVSPVVLVDGAPPTPRIGAPQQFPNLTVTTLSLVAASTDQIRGPLYQQGKRAPQVIATQQHNLLTSTLGAASPDVSAALSGVSATGSVGTATPATDKALSGNAATGAAGTVSPGSSVALTGADGTGAVGTVVPALTVAASGVAATGSPGTVAPSADVSLTGTSSTGEVGTAVAALSIGVSGNEATGNTGDVSGSQSITGVSATGQVGTLIPTTSVAVSGVEGTAQAGTVTPDSSVAVSGVQATGAVGTLTAELSVPLSGIEATGQVGDVTPEQASTAALTGVEATGVVGDIAPSVSIALSGVQASGAVGTASPVSSVSLTGTQATSAVDTVPPVLAVPLTGISATGEVGTVTAQSDNTEVAISGVAATGQVGSASPDIVIALTGVQATALVGSVTRRFGVTSRQMALLEALARIHGLIDPLTVTGTSAQDGLKDDGTISQTLASGLLTTSGLPAGDDTDLGPMSDVQEDWLETLARRFGLIDPLTVSGTGMSDGTFSQSISVSGQSATYTRLS